MKDIYIKLIRYFLSFFDFFQQKKIISFLKRKLQKKIIFFDIGSHHGETVKLFNEYFDIKKFHCFEASPENFGILEKRIKSLDLLGICDLNNFGVGSENSNSFLNQTKETSSSTINKINTKSKYLKRKLKVLKISNLENYIKRIPIKIISLDYYLKNNNIKFIDLIKIDTEGYELEILKGLSKNFNKVKFIYFEHHYDDMIDKRYTFSDIHHILKKNNFKKVFKTKMFFRKSFEYVYQNDSFNLDLS